MLVTCVMRYYNDVCAWHRGYGPGAAEFFHRTAQNGRRKCLGVAARWRGATLVLAVAVVRIPVLACMVSPSFSDTVVSFLTRLHSKQLTVELSFVHRLSKLP